MPAGVALYEFVLKGRKRLGYRVQMDTTATDVVPSPYAGALEQLQENGIRPEGSDARAAADREQRRDQLLR